MGRGLGPTPGCDQRGWGRAGGRTWTIFKNSLPKSLRSCSDESEACGQERGQDLGAPKAAPVGHSGGQVHTQAFPTQAGERPGHTLSFPRKGRQFPAVNAEARPSVSTVQASRPESRGGLISKPTRVQSGSRPFLQAQALSLSGRALYVVPQERSGQKKTFSNLELKILSPSNQGRASWPGSLGGPPEMQAWHMSQGTQRPSPQGPAQFWLSSQSNQHFSPNHPPP